MRPPLRLSASIGLAFVVACSRAPAPAEGPTELVRRRPAPIEDVRDPEAEERNSRGRKEWHRRMHRSPRGVDWESVERVNGLAQVRRHAALRAAPPAPSGDRWVERGSSNQAGRTHVTRLSGDGATMYVGSALGGLWRGSPDGSDWQPLGDATYGGVHFLEVVPGGTGEEEVLVTATEGGIVLRSTDGGTTWGEVEGLGSPWWTRRLAQASDGSGTLYLVQAASEGVRLLRSTDTGASWTAVHDFAGYYGDVFVPRDGTSALWCLDADSVSVSTDEGETWEERGPLPIASSGGDLAGSEAGAPTLFAVLDSATLVRSDDAGATWATVATLSDFWSTSLAASSVDPDLFVYGGVDLYVSRDGGATYTNPNRWYEYYDAPASRLHADIQGIDVIPDGLGGETWYVDTDGGTYRSTDQIRTVENLSLSGLRVGQYYDVLTSSAEPDHVAIGAQDQGYQVTNGVTQDDDVWEVAQILSGDYGHLTSGDGTHEYVFSVYPGFILVQRGETDPTLAYLDFPGGESYVPWLPPIVADPEDPRAFFFPATHLWYYEKTGPDAWVSRRWSEQDFDLAGDEYVSRLAFSPVDPRRAWATTSYGRVWYSDDKGVTWEMSPSLVADENWYYGQAIAPSRSDADTVTIGGSGYGVPAVYRSTDGGRTFFPWDDGLPDTLVYTLVEAADGSGTVFAGTQTAAYRRDPDGEEWEDISSPDAPITIYWDAEALTTESTIRFATYGRGVWDYQFEPDAGETDADGDGHSSTTDCDDDDPTVFPGAVEACDGADRDCDPATPAGGEADEDGDGALACADCDDRDPVRAPGAEELCGDGIDEDCDGADPACEAPPSTSTSECGCSTGTTGEGSLLVVGLLGLLATRRRS